MWQNELRQSAARLVGRASKEEWGLDFWFDKASRLTIKRVNWIYPIYSDTVFVNSTNVSTNIETARSGETAGGPCKEWRRLETSGLLTTAVKTLEMLSIGQQPLF